MGMDHVAGKEEVRDLAFVKVNSDPIREPRQRVGHLARQMSSDGFSQGLCSSTTAVLTLYNESWIEDGLRAIDNAEYERRLILTQMSRQISAQRKLLPLY